MAQISPVRTPNTMLRIILWCSFFEWGCLGIGLFITEVLLLLSILVEIKNHIKSQKNSTESQELKPYKTQTQITKTNIKAAIFLQNPTKNTQSSSCYGLKSSNFCSVFLRASATVQLGGAENATPPRNARSSAESEKKPHGRELQEA
ncbi:hypothetical protein EV2_046128 [Malus domestica]